MSLHLKLLDIDHPLTFEESKLRQIEARALIYLSKKKIPAARIHLLKRYLWHNLVHAIYQDTLGRISENSMRQMFIDMTYTYASKPAARYFNLPSFKHACLFYTK